MPEGSIGLAVLALATMLFSLSAYYLGGPELVAFVWSCVVMIAVLGGATVSTAIDLSMKEWFVSEECDGEIQPEVE